MARCIAVYSNNFSYDMKAKWNTKKQFWPKNREVKSLGWFELFSWNLNILVLPVHRKYCCLLHQDGRIRFAWINLFVQFFSHKFTNLRNLMVFWPGWPIFVLHVLYVLHILNVLHILHVLQVLHVCQQQLIEWEMHSKSVRVWNNRPIENILQKFWKLEWNPTALLHEHGI